MGNRNFRLALMGYTAIAALAFTQAQAQQATAAADSPVLNKIVVKTGTKTAGQKLDKGAADTPLASDVSRDTIDKKDISSISDLGRSTEPGVVFDKARGGLFIRGLGGARVTTLVDGIPIPYLENSARSGGPTGNTNADGGGDSFDFSSLSRADVLRGADSSRAGSGALAGGLVLRTLEPEDLIREGKDWGAIAKTTYDSSNKSIAGSLAAAKAIGNTSVLFQGGWKHGHETGNKGDVDVLGFRRTEPNPADFDQNNLLFKLRQKVEGGHTFGLTAERYDSQRDTDLKTLMGATSGSTRAYTGLKGVDDTRRERVSADYYYDPDATDGLVKAAQATIYWQRLTKEAGNHGTRLNLSGVPSSPWLRSNTIRASSVGASGSMALGFDTGRLTHEVTVGADLSFTQSKQLVRGVDACTLGILVGPYCAFLHANQADIPDVDGKKIGLYVEDRISIGDSAFALTPGARFDWYDFSPKASSDYLHNSGYGVIGLPPGQNGTRISPKLLATYDVNEQVQVYAQWAMAFRAPTADELYLNFINTGQGYAFIGNPNIKPETGHGFEIGANLGDEDFGGRVSAFHNLYNNFIDTRVFTSGGLQTTQAYNRSHVVISGFEVKGNKRFENGINLHGALAYAYGKDTSTEEYIRTIAPLKAVLGVGYEQESWGFDVTTILSANMRKDAPVSNGMGGFYNSFDAPGYGVTDLTAWWEPEQVSGLRIQAGVYNIFDKKYWNAVALSGQDASTAPSNSNSLQPMSYFSEPGRSFKISLTKKF